MEEDEAEATKRYNNPVSFWNILLPVVAVAVVAFLVYLSLPTIVDSVQVVIVWLDWLCMVIRNLIFGSVFVTALFVLIYVLLHKTAEKNKPQRLATVLPPPPPASRQSWGSYFPATEVKSYDGYYNNSNYKEIIEPAFESVKECNCYNRVVMEQKDSKSVRVTRSEKKARTVEYRRMELEKVTKTASWKSQSMDVLSNEEFRTTVETFITEKKKMLSYHQYSFVPQWRNGVADQCGVLDQWQNDVVVPQWRNGVVDQRQNRFLDHWQNDVANANQWLNCVPQCQNDVVKRQGLSEDGTGRRRHRHRSRNHRLVGDSGSTGFGSHLAIMN